MARKNLFDRLPECWKRLDHLYGGVLEKYLGVFDQEYDDLRDKIESVLELRSPNTAADEYIPLLGRLVGYEWDYDKPYNWNRQRIMIAIRRYSYKGTLDAVDDVVIEAGGDEWWVLDMASTVIVPSRQGDLGTPNCYLVAPDYHHPGAYELQVTAAVDDWDVINDHLDRNTAAGEYWYLKTVPGTIPGDMAIRGGLLTMDSLLDLTKTEIQLHEGTSDNPLSELDAVIQACDETPPFSPLFYENCALWYSISGDITLIDGKAAALGDLSKNGHDATQSSPTYRPGYSGSELNGQPVITYGGDGEPQYMTIDPIVTLSGPTAIIFEVVKNTASSTRCSMYPSGSGPYIWQGFSNYKPLTSGGATWGSSVTDWAIVRHRLNDDANSISVNGGTPVTLAGTDCTDGTIQYIGGAITSYPLDGGHAEIIVFDGDLSPIQIYNIENYLATKYGITLT